MNLRKISAAVALSLIGGTIVLLVGMERITDLVLFGTYGTVDTGLDAAIDLGFGMISGLLMVVGATMLFRKPHQNKVWGAVVLVFSLLSIIGTAGGIFLGLLLGLIGGTLAIVRKPSITPP